MKRPTVIRREQCERLAAQNDLDAVELEAAANAIWSSLNPQSYTFDRALSLAFVALRAIAGVRTS